MGFFWICVALLGLGLGVVLSGQTSDLAECKSKLRIAEADREYLHARLKILEARQDLMLGSTITHRSHVIDLEKRRG